jgi:ribosomal protein S18 acetylase RimI-like enzyme
VTRIDRLTAADIRDNIPDLSDILIDCVEAGASVGFLSPLSRERADAFWRSVGDAVEADRRAVFVARQDGSHIDGTVQLVLASAENQPHRADIAKLLVHTRARRQGMADDLMQAAVAHARSIGRDVLVLDTATDEAARLYERLGWTRSGIVPDYALNPDGSRTPTTFYWKSLTDEGAG